MGRKLLYIRDGKESFTEIGIREKRDNDFKHYKKQRLETSSG
jgi:hypothetical protein